MLCVLFHVNFEVAWVTERLSTKVTGKVFLILKYKRYITEVTSTMMVNWPQFVSWRTQHFHLREISKLDIWNYIIWLESTIFYTYKWNWDHPNKLIYFFQISIIISLKCLLDVWPSSLLPRPSLSSILTGVCDQVPQVPPWCVTKFPPSKTFSIFDLDRCVWPSPSSASLMCDQVPSFQDLLYLRSWQVCVTKFPQVSSLMCDQVPPSRPSLSSILTGVCDQVPQVPPWCVTKFLLPRPSLSSILTGVCDQVPQVPPWCVTKFPPSKTFSIFDLDRCLPTKLTRFQVSLTGVCDQVPQVPPWCVTKFPPSKTFSIFDLDRCVWPSSLKSPPWCVTKSLLQDLLYLRSWQVCVTKFPQVSSLMCDQVPPSRPSLSLILTGVCDQVPQVPPWCVTKFPPSKTFSIFDLDRCVRPSPSSASLMCDQVPSFQDLLYLRSWQVCVTKSLKCLLDVWPSSLLPRPSLSSILTGVCDQVPSSLLLDVWPSPSFKTFSIFDLDRCVWPSPSSASLMCDQVPSFQDLLYLRSWQVCVTKSLKCLLDVWPSSLLPRPSLSSILTGAFLQN